MEIYKKLAKAKAEIKATKIKKAGFNSFAKYKYFTPDQIELLVTEACSNNGLITIFDLKRNELGEYGVLRIIDIDTADQIDIEMATAIPEIKATNIAQQLGGCVTYTERYLKTSTFGIADNSVDFDTTENTKKLAEKKPVTKEALTSKHKHFETIITALRENNVTIDRIKEKYTVTAAIEKQINNLINLG